MDNAPFFLIPAVLIAGGVGLFIGSQASTEPPQPPSPVHVGQNSGEVDKKTTVGEISFKGVTYVVFSPGYNSSTGSVELDRQGHVVPCS